jgi:hypothetical protein
VVSRYKKKHSVAFSPQANYTDRATATCWRNLVPTFAVRGMSDGQSHGSPKIVNLVLQSGAATFLSNSSSFFLTRAEWTPFQTHRYGIVLYCIYSKFHQIHIKVQGHIPQDMENVIFHYKMFPLQRNKSMVTVYTYKHTYIHADKCRFN